MKKLLKTAILSNALALFVVLFVSKGFSIGFKPNNPTLGEYCLYMLVLIWLAATCTVEYNGTMRGYTVLTGDELKRDKPVHNGTRNILGLNLFLSGLPVLLGFVISNLVT